MTELFPTKLYSKMFIKTINTWAVPLVRYSWSYLKRTMEELKQMDQRTRKLMSMHEALHLWDDTDRFYQEKKEEEDLPVFKIAMMYIYDSKTTYTCEEENW